MVTIRCKYFLCKYLTNICLLFEIFPMKGIRVQYWYNIPNIIDIYLMLEGKIHMTEWKQTMKNMKNVKHKF